MAPVASVCLIIFLLFGVFACAPSIASQEDADPSLETSLTGVVWSVESNCATCHVAESASSEESSRLVRVHVGEGLDCVGCHTDTSKLTTIHEPMSMNVQSLKQLKETAMPESFCFECHDESELVSMTSESRDLTDSRETTVNPHAIPRSIEHDALDCVDCHSMHGDQPVAEQAMKTCINCHHAGVFECRTCH
jgi:hypothetical protein